MKKLFILSFFLILIFSVFPASNDNNVEWDGLYHSWNNDADGVVPGGGGYRYREPYNETYPGTIYDDEQIILTAQSYQFDLTEVWVRWWDGAEHWTQGSWDHNYDPGGGSRDYWRINLGSHTPSDTIWYQIQVKDGTDDDYMVDIADPHWSNADGQDVDEDMDGTNRVEYHYLVSDDDTTGPVIDDKSPTEVYENDTFLITCYIDDDQTDSGDNDSGVYDSSDDTDPYQILIYWDTDGEISSTFNTMTVSLITGATDYYKGDNDFSLQLSDNFVYSIHAYNNDHDNNWDGDRDLTITSLKGIKVKKSIDNNDTILFPEWSFDANKIAYIRTNQSTSNIFIKDLVANSTPGQLTANSDNVFYPSNICFSPDGNFIAFSAPNIDGNLQIYKVSTDPADSNPREKISPDSSVNWGRMLDPNWGTTTNQYNNVERILVSVSGDIWTFEPASVNFDKNFVRVTGLSDPYKTEEEIQKCYEPRWTPDNQSILFVVRNTAYDTETANADIYLLNEVQTIIQKALNGDTTTYPTSLSDTRIVQITSSSHPEWSPSFSRDGTRVSYTTDLNDAFNNVLFQSNCNRALTKANFYVYHKNSDGIGTEQYVEGKADYNSAFSKWAPANGDFFTLVSQDTINTISELVVISYPSTYNITGFSKGKGGNTVVSDHSLCSLSFDNNDIYSPFSVTITPKLPYRFKTGELELLGEIRKINFSDSIIHKAQLQMFVSNEEKKRALPLVIGNIKGNDITILESSIRRTEIGEFISCNIDQSGTYGVFYLKTSNIDEGSVKVYPNPANDTPIIFHSSLVIKSIIIYNISGEKVLSKSDINSTNTQIDLHSFSSGLYIAVLNFSGYKIVKKIAIIK